MSSSEVPGASAATYDVASTLHQSPAVKSTSKFGGGPIDYDSGGAHAPVYDVGNVPASAGLPLHQQTISDFSEGQIYDQATTNPSPDHGDISQVGRTMSYDAAVSLTSPQSAVDDSAYDLAASQTLAPDSYVPAARLKPTQEADEQPSGPEDAGYLESTLGRDATLGCALRSDAEAVDDWLAGIPASSLDRAGAEALLRGSGEGPGAFCFRPSSKPGMVVLCVLVGEKVANIRLELRDEKVVVHDLGAPLVLPTMEAVLDHFSDLTNQPNNSVALGNCIPPVVPLKARDKPRALSFEDNTFVLDPKKNSLRLASVRRSNPLYRQSRIISVADGTFVDDNIREASIDEEDNA